MTEIFSQSFKTPIAKTPLPKKKKKKKKEGERKRRKEGAKVTLAKHMRERAQFSAELQFEV